MHKKIFLLVVLAVGALTAGAKCSGGNLTAWPNGKIISQNPVLMLEGYAGSKKIIAGLNTTYRVYLRSGKQAIGLKVKETHMGQYGLQQALLVPEQRLVAGFEYTLHIDSVSEYEKPKRYNETTDEYEVVKWKVEAFGDNTAPAWIKKPWETKKEVEPFGCGPAVYVHFGSKVEEKNDYLVKITLTAVNSNTARTYYISPGKNQSIDLGHGMCSGAFKFSEKNYTVTFDLMDSSGNITYWTGEPVKFTAPEV